MPKAKRVLSSQVTALLDESSACFTPMLLAISPLAFDSAITALENCGLRGTCTSSYSAVENAA